MSQLLRPKPRERVSPLASCTCCTREFTLKYLRSNNGLCKKCQRGYILALEIKSKQIKESEIERQDSNMRCLHCGLWCREDTLDLYDGLHCGNCHKIIKIAQTFLMAMPS